MTKRIVVIGSNSFSGASFCRYMLDRDYEIIAISRSLEPIGPLLPYRWSERSHNLQFVQMDLNHDLGDIEQLLDNNKPSFVYNFAAQSMVAQSWNTPEHWFNTNVVATVKFHNMLKNKDYLEKYVHISTPEVYGSCQGSVTEQHAFNPSTPYAVSRAAADMSLKTFYEVYGFPVVTTRAANVYGPGQQLYRIIPKTILSIMQGKRLPLHGGGLSERSFIHINDVACATRLVAEQGNVGESYHIATEDMISIRGLVELICNEMNVDVNDVCELSEERPGKDALYMLNSQKIRDQFGWQDCISLEAGIGQCISWVKENYGALIQQPLEYVHKP
ncbi:MAG: GDP-mannose 4,6-dehydratase [Aestuariibacter sp.]